MTATIVVLDHEAELYARRIGEAVPGVTIHAGHTEAEVLDACSGADALMALAHHITPDMVKAAAKLRWIQALTTGVDSLLSMAQLSPAVPITSARGIHGPQMSELAFFFMLNHARDVRAVLRDQAGHVWDRRPQRLLFGRTAAIVGVGAIGEELAQRCKAFGMRTIGVSSRDSAPGFDAMVPRERITEAAAQADYLIAIVPLSVETHHLIDARVIAAMPRHAVLINIARGPVVDEAALVAALDAGSIAGAALDVFEIEPLPRESSLWDRSNVLVTPRIGGMSDIYAEQILPLLIHNVAAFRDGRMSDLRNRVRG